MDYSSPEALFPTATPKRGTDAIDYYKGEKNKVSIQGVDVQLKGQSPTGSGNPNDSPFHERAAYLVSKMLKLDLVPSTVLFVVNGKVASAMKWIDEGERPDFKIDKPPELHAFDYIIGDGDRHNGNWLVEPDGRVWAIDNALSFGTYTSGYSYDEPLPMSLKNSINGVLDDTKYLRKELKGLLSREQITALIKRMKNLTQQAIWE